MFKLDNRLRFSVTSYPFGLSYPSQSSATSRFEGINSESSHMTVAKVLHTEVVVVVGVAQKLWEKHSVLIVSVSFHL